MLTVEQENYLKTVLDLGGDSDYVSNKALVQQLNIKPSSVTEMMQRLGNLGYLDSKPYKGTKLTSDGYKHTLMIIRRHRLIENFLIKELGYNWQEVHAEAEVLEHHVSDQFIERLDKHLGYPATCPHGGVIPRNNHFEEVYNTSLREAKLNTVVTIKRVKDTAQLLAYLSDKHINIDDKVEVISQDQQVLIKKNGKEMMLDGEVAEKIYINIE